MTFCLNCGNRLNDGDRFCFKCGAKTGGGDTTITEVGESEVPGAAVCSKCGAKALPGDRFCGSCGAEIGDSKAPVSRAEQRAEHKGVSSKTTCSRCHAEVLKSDYVCFHCGNRLGGDEALKVEGGEIGKFISATSVSMCVSADKNNTKAKDMTSYIESAIAIGLILAKRQPELTDSCVQWWSTTRQGNADEFVDGTIQMYNNFKVSQGK